jgi:hypothetical protein
MRQMIKNCFWIALLISSWQTVWAFSLLGPSGNGGDAWQQEIIGFDPIGGYTGAPPFFGPDPVPFGPKNLGEEYRRNTPVMYYTCDANFLDYFGLSGEAAIDQAFAILNNLTNVDSYSTNLSEFPLNTTTVNYKAQALDLLDLKSETLSLMTEQMGLADSVRYVWALHNRFQPTAAPCPLEDYQVIMRNFDFMNSPLNQLQYSAYVNAELYSYFIDEICDSPAAPPNADAVEFPVDPLVNNPPVASINEDGLQTGSFFTGLTRDDVAGLRYLMSSNNIIYEDLVPGSTPVAGGGSTFTNLNDEFSLVTSNLTTLILASTTNGPAALQALYPGLVILNVTTNFFTGAFTYTFGNVVDNHFSTNTPVQIQVQTTTIGPFYGSGVGSPLQTNTTTSTTTILSNLDSGDFFLIPTNTCGLDIISSTLFSVVTNTVNLGSFTNVSGQQTTITSTNIVTLSTNYTLLVAPCEFLNGAAGTNSTTGLFEGVENIKFIRADFDSLLGQTFQPITNQYSVMMVVNSKLVPSTFQRVVTQPDVLFTAADLVPGPSAVNSLVERFSRTVNFDQAHIGAGLAGPGVIDPSSTITYNKVGPVFFNAGPASLSLSSAAVDGFVWGSFDGTTNDPVVYGNGTSIADLEAQVLVQISPSSLPNGTHAVAYPSTTFGVTGGAFTQPFTWSSPGGLPPGLTLSSAGTISGTPTQSGTFNFIIELTDVLSRSVTWSYSITIN